MKKSLFVGSFNPITTAHENIVRDLLENKTVDFVYFLPVNSKKKDLASIEDRMYLINILEILNSKVLNVYDFEESGLFYYDILKKIEKAYCINSIIMGKDLFLNFKNFKNYEKILEEFTLIVINRCGSVEEEIQKNYSNYKDKIIVIEKEYVGSSLKAKENLKKKNKYLNSKVLAYIKEKNLYG